MKDKIQVTEELLNKLKENSLAEETTENRRKKVKKMANKKFKEIAKIKKETRNNKIKDLKVELAKARIDASKGEARR
jgi:ClpP class serine protease